VLPTGCVHEYLEQRFGDPNILEERGPCGTSCWWCVEKGAGTESASSTTDIQAVSKDDIVNILSGEDGFHGGARSAVCVVKALYKNREFIWED